MPTHDSLFRDSLWSHETDDLVLHHYSTLEISPTLSFHTDSSIYGSINSPPDRICFDDIDGLLDDSFEPLVEPDRDNATEKLVEEALQVEGPQTVHYSRRTLSARTSWRSEKHHSSKKDDGFIIKSRPRTLNYGQSLSTIRDESPETKPKISENSAGGENPYPSSEVLDSGHISLDTQTSMDCDEISVVEPLPQKQLQPRPLTITPPSWFSDDDSDDGQQSTTARSSRPMFSPLSRLSNLGSRLSHRTSHRVSTPEPVPVHMPSTAHVGTLIRQNYVNRRRQVHSARVFREKLWEKQSLPDLQGGRVERASYANLENVDIGNQNGSLGVTDRPVTWYGSSGSESGSGPAKLSKMRRLFSTTTILMSHLLAQSAIGQTLPIDGMIADSFHDQETTGKLSWSIAAYTLAVGACVVFAERLGARLGPKRIFVAGLITFGLWAAVAAASIHASQTLFIICQAGQGIGAALTLPTGFALLVETWNGLERQRIIFAVYASMTSFGLFCGALKAALLALAWWPLAFWVETSTLVVLVILGSGTLPPDSTHAARRREEADGASLIQALDVPSLIVCISALILFGFAWNQSLLVGWEEPYLWVSLIGAVLLAVVFVMFESLYARQPLVPFKNLTLRFWLILIVTTCAWCCFGVWLFYAWRYVMAYRTSSTLLGTAYFVPVLIIGCLATVTIHSRTTLDKPVLYATLCTALVTMTAGAVLVATMPSDQIYWAQLFVSMLIMAWGVYTCTPVAYLLISQEVDQCHHRAAMSMTTAVTYYGIALGLGIAGTVLREVRYGRQDSLYDLQDSRDALWTSAAFGGLGLVASLTLSCISIHRRYCAPRHHTKSIYQ
ncbi:major facilitator superfamily domain-containing protein [Xylariaceae sp. FL0255]|nr:major facilitator superfamily domain-containing protein [Xylariaceae sp. FL0255]